MTAEQHFKLAQNHGNAARSALRRFIESDNAETGHDWAAWDEYKAEYLISSKHFGIYRAMTTKKAKKQAAGKERGTAWRKT